MLGVGAGRVGTSDGSAYYLFSQVQIFVLIEYRSVTQNSSKEVLKFYNED